MTLLTELPIQRLQFYLTAPYPCSYLPDRMARSQVATPAGLVDTPVFGELVRLGFRRSGHYVYRPRCDACQACLPARVAVADFQPRRSQRRNQVRNRDIDCVLHPLEFSEAHYDLYRRYQAARHAGGGMDMDDREQYRAFLLASQVDSALAEFRLDGRLVMVSLIDRLLDGLSAVYTFYEPDLAKRGLGVHNVLTQIRLAAGLDLPYLYLGYWIEKSPKMAYKSDYQPLEVYRDRAWQTPAETEMEHD
ncbi:MAG: arginyltransferase [Hydrogenophilaceae bacterium CG1_02_62_390]|nr:arginyltransferase [Betaproteobacteria bacterium]OIO77524.1 MAG: arginyltransferase [Hydrogenophilaceae bacterium CG1_02_62_390]PIW38035.1 MAG: arginyltransferase [Hydrogenophilales bacterium CG15_BIG_FIL_POST_REV_8_21_14_020_62_31]PIW70838.1 MAG: arginyltransferase [Hydrogenophilales bacterium CG12_big_fil_rev_8_21_14_0_65_61_21]PIX01249.1 MAG: arginyltransferase [Hydrogenophilales bacterium CG_4_8_14_3_um_filter_62_83]PIY99236.1 MAG: arginyltransferase [Hydrogenophilales bacterium CG_4_10